MKYSQIRKGVAILAGQLQMQTYIDNRCWKADDLPLLSAEAVLPHWDGKGGERFNRYYRSYARAFARYCEKELLPLIREEYRQAVLSSGALPPIGWSFTPP